MVVRRLKEGVETAMITDGRIMVTRVFRAKSDDVRALFLYERMPPVNTEGFDALRGFRVTNIRAQARYGWNVLRRLFRKPKWWRLTVVYEATGDQIA